MTLSAQAFPRRAAPQWPAPVFGSHLVAPVTLSSPTKVPRSLVKVHSLHLLLGRAPPPRRPTRSDPQQGRGSCSKGPVLPGSIQGQNSHTEMSCRRFGLCRPESALLRVKLLGWLGSPLGLRTPSGFRLRAPGALMITRFPKVLPGGVPSLPVAKVWLQPDLVKH